MKILTIVFGLSKGGVERTAQNFAVGYKQLGHDSRILAMYELGSRYSEIKDILHVWLGTGIETYKEIYEFNPDVVHVHSHNLKENDIRPLLSKLKSQKAIVIEKNVFSLPSSYNDLVDISFQPSKWCQWLFNIRGGSNLKSAVVPNLINEDFFYRALDSEILEFRKKYNIPKNSFVIGRIGQAYTGKWSLSLIDAFNNTASCDEDVYLVVVNAPKFILNAVHQSPYRKRIINISKIIGDRNLSIAYSSFNVTYLAAQQGESFGNVIIESILCGTPVIVLATPWADNSQMEVVENNVGGLVVHTTLGAISAIEYMKENQASLNFSEIGPKSVKKRYNHLKISQLALDYATGVRKVEDDNIVSDNDILFLLDNSFEKPKNLTKIFLKLGLRRLTRYSSGYESWFVLPKNIFCKSLKKIKNNINITVKA